MPVALVDTGVWLAICDPRDGAAPRDVIEDVYTRIKAHSIVVPWPIAYETVRTRFAKHKLAMQRFEQEIKTSRMHFVDDAPYRENALALSFDSLRRNRPLSLVDCLIRLFLDDVNTKVNYFVTFNQRDFHDICARRRVELWDR